MELIGNRLEQKSRKHSSVSPIQQLLVALRFYSTGNFQLDNAELLGISQPTISRIVQKVSGIIASKYRDVVTFPSGNRILEVQRGFMNISGIPGVVGAIDCTHIPNSPQVD